MTASPHFDLGRLRDLEGRLAHPLRRRVGLAVLAVIVIAALTGKLGQTEQTRTVANAAAALEVRAPQTLRSGLLWRTRIVVTARQELVQPELTLGSGFADGMQLNTIEPAPTDETTVRGALVFSYPTIAAGDTLTVYLQLQSDPTVIGRQDLGVTLRSRDAPALDLPRTTRVLP